MTRNLRFLGSGILGLASLAASAGPPGTVPPTAPASATTATLPLGTQPTVAAPSGATAMVPQLTTAPADGDLHVSMIVNVNVSGLSPFVTQAGLECVAALANHDQLVVEASAINAGTLVSADLASSVTPLVWGFTFSLPIQGGLYRGAQSALFVVPAWRFRAPPNSGPEFYPNPALLFACALMLTGNLNGASNTSVAELHAGAARLPTPETFYWISSGSAMFAVTQDITLKPLT